MTWEHEDWCDPDACTCQDVCGVTRDHDLEEHDSADGITHYVCRTCGAEIIVDEAGDDDFS